MINNYNFVPYEPHKRNKCSSEVSLHKSGEIWINEHILKGYTSKELPICAQIYVDVENKIIGLKFYEKKDSFGKINLFKLYRRKKSWAIYTRGVMSSMGIETIKKVLKVKPTKTKNDMMVLDISKIAQQIT